MLHSPRTALRAALACLAGLALTGVLAYLVPVARVRDAATLQGFTGLNRPRLTPLIDSVARLADPLPYAVIGFSLAALALSRQRPRVAGSIVVLLLATGLTTMVLKPLLAAPRYDSWLGSGQIDAASWPSGHATAAMTLALCAILAVPARRRATAAVLGAGFVVTVSYAILALGWHFPSDVFGGFLVATTWTLLAVAGLRWAEERWPSDAPREAASRRSDALAPVALVLGAAAVVAAALASRPVGIARYAADHSTFVAGAAAIAALAAALVLGLAHGVSRSPR